DMVTGVPVVGVAHLDVARPGQTEWRVLVVLHVDVGLVGGRHDHLVAAGDGVGDLLVFGRGAPVLGDGVGGGCAPHDLVPAERTFAVLLHDRHHALHERAVILRRRRPCLVPADVQVRSGRQFRDLTDDVVHELVGDLLVDAQGAVADLDVGARWRGDAVAVQFRVRGQRGVGVSRHVDLRDDGDVPLGGVGDDVAVVVLGEVTAAHTVDTGARSTAHGGEFGPAFDLDAPALVVRQVDVQVVDLVARDFVDVGLDLIKRVEVARDVEHGAAVGEPWVVDDAAAGHGPRLVLGCVGFDRGGQ